MYVTRVEVLYYAFSDTKTLWLGNRRDPLLNGGIKIKQSKHNINNLRLYIWILMWVKCFFFLKKWFDIANGLSVARYIVVKLLKYRLLLLCLNANVIFVFLWCIIFFFKIQKTVLIAYILLCIYDIFLGYFVLENNTKWM